MKTKLHFHSYQVPAKTMEVEPCGQCPYVQSNNGHGEPAFCTHPKAPKGFYANATGIWLSPPKWCPGRVK